MLLSTESSLSSSHATVERRAVDLRELPLRQLDGVEVFHNIETLVSELTLCDERNGVEVSLARDLLARGFKELLFGIQPHPIPRWFACELHSYRQQVPVPTREVFGEPSNFIVLVLRFVAKAAPSTPFCHDTLAIACPTCGKVE